ncbi:unnamed protein product [Lactuca virosa]|uniref:Reverse transcriptase zinc-binding domain-containing protein n=1 Tax=Lactuca virosa TaxID=75947 RepID=A0AAU9MBH7_9ASTR|nr:unnamed protein product [Lactuca virosa]
MNMSLIVNGSLIIEKKSRGVNVGSTRYSYCEVDDESWDHILVGCDFAKTTFEWIFRWCGISGYAVLES